MIIKQAFLSVFRKIMAFCIAMTMFVFTAHATIPSEYVAITPDDTTQYPETLSGYTKLFIDGNVSWGAVHGSGDGLDYYRYKLYSANNVVSATVAPQISDRLIRNSIGSSNSGIGVNVYYSSSSSGTYIAVRDPSKFTSTSTVQTYFTNNPMTVLYKKSSNPDNNNFVAVKRVSDGALGYYCESGASAGDFVVAYGMTGTVNPCPGGTLQTYTTVASTDVPTGVQNGTPTPTNPIEPVFYQQGKMTLRRIGDYADSYDATTGKITRRVGVKVFDGTENWFYSNPTDGSTNNYLGSMYNLVIDDMYAEASSVSSNRASPYSTHFTRSTNWIGTGSNRLNKIQAYKPASVAARLGLGYPNVSNDNIPVFKQWLAQQYAAGTPVTVYYPLTESNYYTEDWSAEQCSNAIKIATRAYNTTQFAPVVTALNTAVDTIKNVVTNTINQTAAVSALQSTKQTRPDEECPAGKKCLLVEDVDGTPHWYEIIERAPGIVPAGSGYTQVAYLQMPAGSYINTTVVPQGDYRMEFDFATTSLPASNTTILGERAAAAPGAGIQLGLGTTGQFTFDGLGSRYQPTTLATANTRYKYVWDNKTVTLTSGSTTIGTNTFTDSQEQTYPLVINGLNNAGTMSGNAQIRSYSFKAWNASGSYVADFVPARRNSDGVLGMYDTVSGNFFTNAGSGEFTTPGYLPASFTQLAYIESTGTQYIDTGSAYKSSRIYNVDFQYVVYPNGAKGSLGARQTSTAGTGTFDIGCNQTLFYFYNNSTPANVREPRDLARHTVEIDYTNSVFKFDGETLPWTTGTGAWQGTYNIYIGRENIAGSPNTSVGTVKWYSYKVYDNGTLVQDLVPAKNASGVIGMYDLADPNPATAFHTNAGTGTFTAGPEI